MVIVISNGQAKNGWNFVEMTTTQILVTFIFLSHKNRLKAMHHPAFCCSHAVCVCVVARDAFRTRYRMRMPYTPLVEIICRNVSAYAGESGPLGDKRI